MKGEKTKKKTRRNIGEKVFLDGVRDCIDMRAKIFGLYESEKFEFSWKEDLRKMGFSEKEIDETLSQAADIVEGKFKEAEKTEK